MGIEGKYAVFRYGLRQQAFIGVIIAIIAGILWLVVKIVEFLRR